MSEGKHEGLAQVMQVFISSPSVEMKPYREKAIEAIRDAGMIHKNYNDPKGAGFTQGKKTIFDMNRDTVMSSDVFVALYGFGRVWRPYDEPSVRNAHPELSEDPEKLIMEYELDWAEKAGLYRFLFMRTWDTREVPSVPMDERMDQFRSSLRGRSVGWLTTPDEFSEQLIEGLRSIRPRVFLSYSRKNVEDVKRLQQRLRDEDVHAWRDEANIPGGTDWAKMIEAALEGMDAMVVVATAESARSEWVEKECKAFVERGKIVIPYIADEAAKNSLPTYLTSLQYIDGTVSDGFSKLVQRLRIVLASA